MFQEKAAPSRDLVGIRAGSGKQQLAVVINETGGQLGLAKGFGIGQGVQEADVGFYPSNAVLPRACTMRLMACSGFVPQ